MSITRIISNIQYVLPLACRRATGFLLYIKSVGFLVASFTNMPSVITRLGEAFVNDGPEIGSLVTNPRGQGNVFRSQPIPAFSPAIAISIKDHQFVGSTDVGFFLTDGELPRLFIQTERRYRLQDLGHVVADVMPPRQFLQGLSETGWKRYMILHQNKLLTQISEDEAAMEWMQHRQNVHLFLVFALITRIEALTNQHDDGRDPTLLSTPLRDSTVVPYLPNGSVDGQLGQETRSIWHIGSERVIGVQYRPVMLDLSTGKPKFTRGCSCTKSRKSNGSVWEIDSDCDEDYNASKCDCMSYCGKGFMEIDVSSVLVESPSEEDQDVLF
jgi:hypothetical protein